jgi:hypothetical protein
MWGRLFVGLLLVVALAAGYPYASLIVNRIIGTNTVVFTEHDGVQRTLISGPDAPRPAWVPVLPRSFIVHAGHWVPSPGREIAGDLELLTHKNIEEIKRFYLQALNAAGFDIHDIGYGPLNPLTAAYLGIGNMLQGHRSDGDLTITVTTNTADGFILPSRMVKIHWQRQNESSGGGRAAAAADR